MNKYIYFVVNILILLLLTNKVNAWEEHDFEIFDVHDAITKLKGSNATFYSVLNVDPSASVDVLNKAYRKVSLEIHPDKTTDKNLRELYTQVNLIINMLRDKQIRSRYDYFLKVGVPKWRGTGYYYSRYKPNLGTVLTIIVIGICCMQVLLSWTNYFTQKYRINSVKKEMDLLTYQEVKKILRKENKDVTKEMFRKSTPSEILINNSDYIEFNTVEKPSFKDILVIKLPLSIVMGIINAPKNIRQAYADYNEYKERVKREKEELEKENNENHEDEEEEEEEEEEEDKDNKIEENSIDGNEEDFTKPSKSKKKKRVNRKKMVNGLTPEQIEKKKLQKAKLEEEKEHRKKAREEASRSNVNPFSGLYPLLPSPLHGSDEEKEGEKGNKQENGNENQGSSQAAKEEESEEEMKTGPWSKEEYALLVRLSNKYPVGTPGRWVRIGMEMKRDVDEVADNVKLLKSNPKLAMGIVQ